MVSIVKLHTRLITSGMGTLVGAPAYVMPATTDTILGANVVSQLGNLILDDWKIFCVSSDANTSASLSAFYECIRRGKKLVKLTAREENNYWV